MKELLRGQDGVIRPSEHLEGCGDDLFKRACALELEGLFSKRKGSKYRSGRSTDWTKRTCRHRETFIVAGIALNRGKFEGIYLAREEKGQLRYVGKVENGFTAQSEKELRSQAEKLGAKTQPFAKKIKKPKAKWLKPALEVEVKYRALTGTGKLRHPSFKGLREDVPLTKVLKY